MKPPIVMGILNVTPDSFSDGGCWSDQSSATARGLAMADEGAQVIDVGGESTRPGATPVDEAEERRRVVPVVEALAAALPAGVRISVDTRRASVAKAAVAAGATLVNDVSASLWPVAAETGVGWAAVHMRGTPASMQDSPSYDDVVSEVREFLVASAGKAKAAGVGEVWIDPGIGFGKTVGHNLSLLRHLDTLVSTGLPVMVGTSRKAFLGRVGVAEGAPPAPVGDRLEGSLATAVWAITQGVAMVRAHDVAHTVRAAKLAVPSASAAGIRK